MDSTTLIFFLAIGAVAGWLANAIMKGRGLGLIGDVIVGTIGAVVVGTLFRMLGMTAGSLIGAIITATGFDLMLGEQAEECGYGKYVDVMDGLEFERILSASGPTQGEVRRPSDGKTPKDVVFIQCVGSRNPEHGVPYCSRVCCMYTAKHALLLKHKVPDSRAFVFYMDIRAGGKGYEEFVHRVMEEERVIYIRGRVSQVIENDGKLKVMGVDTLSGRPVEIDADMVVLGISARRGLSAAFSSHTTEGVMEKITVDVVALN